jgi:hypothetical protein
MRAIRRDLTEEYAIEKGALWRMTILVEGDYTTYGCRGQIRDKEDGELYADFQFEPLITVLRTVNREEVVFTRIMVYLGAPQTMALPTTKPRQFLRYDVEIFHPTDVNIVHRLVLGDVETSPNITLP